MARYRVKLLGLHGVTTAAGEPIDFPSGKPFALLSYLVLAGRPVPRVELAALLWPDSPRERGLQSVRQSLWFIRRVLGEGVVRGDDRLAVGDDEVTSDIEELRDAVVSGALERVHGLWTGAVLERLEVTSSPAWEKWLDERRRGLRREVVQALQGGAEEAVSAGDLERALLHLRKACEVEPYGFELQVRRVELLLLAGHRQEAQQALWAASEQFGDAEYAPVLERLERRFRHRHQAREDAGVNPLLHPELVGRSGDLAVLAGEWQQARQGRTRRVLLTGEAGVGKTRLVQELSRIAHDDGGRTVMVGPTAPDRTPAWGALATLVRGLLDLPGAGGVSTASDAVLRRLVPGRSQPETPVGDADAAALRDAVVDLVGAVAYESPLLIALEDVQWLDAPSWALLSRLVAEFEGEAVLFLVTWRSGDVEPASGPSLRLLVEECGSRSLQLENFTAAQTGDFLALHLGETGSEVVRRLHALTGGNPRDLVEVLKTLRERGALVQRDGTWELDAERVPSDLQPPAGVQEAVHGGPRAALRVRGDGPLRARGRAPLLLGAVLVAVLAVWLARCW